VVSYTVQGNHVEIITEVDIPPEKITALFHERVVEATPRLPALTDIFKRMIKVEAIHE